jgi:hypothetical protein
MSTSVKFDNLRSLGFASISASYAALGTALTTTGRLICLTNNTDGDMFISDDGINDKLFLAAGSFKLFDFQTNREDSERKFVVAKGTQFSVRQSTAPTKGAVYLEVIYG